MLMCYVDESGDTGSLDPNERNSQPMFLISAVPTLSLIVCAVVSASA